MDLKKTKHNLINVLLLLLSVCSISCTNQNSNAEEYCEAIGYSPPQDGVSIIFVAPISGCRSCIQQSLDIYDVFTGNIECQWIFSGFNKLKANSISSQQSFKLLYIIDKDDLAYKYNILKSSYPVILIFDDGTYKQKISINYDDSTLKITQKLQKLIAQSN